MSTIVDESKVQFDKEELLKNLDVSCSLGQDYISGDDESVMIIISPASVYDMTCAYVASFCTV